MRAEFKRTEKLTLIGIPSSQRSTMCEYNWLIIAKTIISLIIDRRSPTYDTIFLSILDYCYSKSKMCKSRAT